MFGNPGQGEGMTATATITAESTSRFADVGGFRLHYNETGSGPAVVMLDFLAH